MTITKKLMQGLVAGVLALGLTGTALADDKARNTVIGAGLGGVAGALLSEGDPWMTLGGAAAGGVLGHVITDDDDDRRDRRRWDRGDRDRDHFKRADYRKHDRMRGKGHHKHRHHR